ncbi:DUF4126 domain-containing protein [Lentisphaera marina]|nr:DUF4126 domain-containing protein [Lentisphaera marina]MDD7984045.1 DUF4126 domain-containing protein [Lentisphaera marina]
MEIELLTGLCIGIGLSAACGFRVFVPMLGVSLASRAGHMELGSGFEWLGGDLAMIVLLIATICEVAAYFVPWVDNLLDTIAAPAAVVAGTILTGAMTGEMSPVLKWSLALIAGGGAAATVQAVTTVVRGTSTVTTGGIGNPVVAAGELAGATGVTLLAVFVPIAAVILVMAALIYLGFRVMKKKPKTELAQQSPA